MTLTMVVSTGTLDSKGQPKNAGRRMKVLHAGRGRKDALGPGVVPWWQYTGGATAYPN